MIQGFISETGTAILISSRLKAYHSKSLSGSSAKLTWTSRSDAPIFVEQLPVASGQIVEHKRRWDWNGPVAGLREPMACIRRGAHHLDCHRLHARSFMMKKSDGPRRSTSGAVDLTMRQRTSARGVT